MKGLIKGGILSLAVIAFSVIAFSGNAWATSQWAKKYGITCTECHTLFPRLSYMGEKFMRDGYQFGQDGNDNKQKINDRLYVDELKHLFGIRLNVRPLEYKTNGVTRNGEKRSRLHFGQTNWVQFFVAGSIYKNVSIFIENELKAKKGQTHFSWYKLGFHNLFGPEGAANILIGQQAPMEWMPNSGRLRVVPDGENWAWGPSGSGANDAGEDDARLIKAQQAISFYGYQGPVVYFAGVGPGKASGSSDLNNKANYWLGGRVEATSGQLEGSAFAVFAMMGTDAKDTATNQITNDFDRYSIQGMLRSGGTEFSASYSFGKDENWEYAATSAAEKEQEFKAIFLQAAHQFGADKQYYAAIRYEDLTYDDEKLADSTDRQSLGLSIFYTPMENLKVGYTAILDIGEESSDTYGNGHHGDDRSNTHHITIRTMF